jgi:hypothetical protein
VLKIWCSPVWGRQSSSEMGICLQSHFPSGFGSGRSLLDGTLTSSAAYSLQQELSLHHLWLYLQDQCRSCLVDTQCLARMWVWWAALGLLHGPAAV